ncbi:MAG: LuxR family transcriptional regulator [Flaviaesturariibacter sp.]|nr:LuxR family transcriptional regulator [Flaviaesturariibacter sp.]
MRMRVLIADDLVLFRDGLELLLERGGATVVGKAKDGAELLRLARSTRPEAILTDIQMPVMDGIAATRELRALYPAVPVIALTQYDEDHLIADMLAAGAQGYLLKHSCMDEVFDALATVREGSVYYCDGTSKRLLKIVAGINTKTAPEKPELTEADKAILCHLCEQLSTKEIADRMELGVSTVEKYRARLMEKLGSRNVAGLVVWAMKNGVYG